MSTDQRTDEQLPPQTEEEKIAWQIAREVEQLHIRREAKIAYESARAADDWAPPQGFDTVADGLAAPREPRQFLVDQLIIENGNVLVTAGHKTGKTTLGWNLLRALCDRVPFLDSFDTRPLAGRVAYWDYELDADYAYTELAKIGLRRGDLAVMLNLRGHSMPIENDLVAEWAVTWLRERDTEVWVLDPFGAAFSGEENSNTEVREWLKRLDMIKMEAGVKELVLVTHSGRSIVDEGAEHSRGASRLEDWPDVLWKYTKDTTGAENIPTTQRYLTAFGRGVDHPEFALSYDPLTLRLSHIEGSGSRSEQRRAALADAIIRHVMAEGPCNTSSIKSAVPGKSEYVTKALAELVKDGVLAKEEVGTSNIYSVPMFVAQRMGRENTGDLVTWS